MINDASAKQVSRLEARVSPEIKELCQKAADLEGLTLTDFVIVSVREKALQVIEQHQKLQLGIEDSIAFIDALLNPPEPNEALKAAAQRYQKLTQA